MVANDTLNPWIWPPLCGLAVMVLLWAQAGGHGWLRAVAKLTASSAFVAWAWSLGAAGHEVGRWLLVALLLGWLGDALLLGSSRWAFVGGLLAFLLGHALFVVAFWRAGVMPAALPLALLAALLLAGRVGRWLQASVPSALRAPVWAYLAVIALMLAVAAAQLAARPTSLQAWIACAGALVFAVSDLAVARDRFVNPDPQQDARWGLPLYYLGQLMLGWGLGRL